VLAGRIQAPKNADQRQLKIELIGVGSYWREPALIGG